MTLTRYLRSLRRLWPALILTTLIGTAIGVGSALLMPQTFESEATIFVNVSQSASVSDLQMGEQFAQARAASYAAIGTSSEVLDPVQDELGIDLTDAVTVTNLPNTAVLRVTAEDEDPQRSADIASKAAESLAQRSAELEGASTAGTSPVQLSVVNKAQVPERPSAPSMPLNILVGAVVGLIAGLLFVLARAQSNEQERTR